jgi:hypothetical protein
MIPEVDQEEVATIVVARVRSSVSGVNGPLTVRCDRNVFDHVVAGGEQPCGTAVCRHIIEVWPVIPFAIKDETVTGNPL